MQTTVGQTELFDSPAGGPERLAAGAQVLISAGQLARAFNVGASAVSRWPLTVVERRGREIYFDLAEAVALRLGEHGKLSLDQERTRLARAAADRAELELAARAGTLIVAEDALRAYAQQIAAAKNILRGRARTLTEEIARVGGVPRSKMTTVAAAIEKSDQTVLLELAGDTPEVAADE